MMKYRDLGPFKASVIGFGGWQLGGEYWGDVNLEDGENALACALDHGVNLIDTAPLYGKGEADKRISRVLGARRHEVIIATKTGVSWEGEHAQSILTADLLQQDIHASLKRLQLDSLPIVQIHWPCELGTPLEETFTALAKLQQKGDIQHIGICNYPAKVIPKILQYTPLISIQSPYSMIRREVEVDIVPMAKNHQLATIAYEVLGRGLLTAKYRHEHTFPAHDLRSHDPRFHGLRFQSYRPLLQFLVKAANKLDVPVSALAIAWSLQRFDIALVGNKTRHQLLQNLRALRLIDSQKNLVLLDKVLAQLHL